MLKINSDGNVKGQFVDQNTQTGTPGTVLSAIWLNHVQNELVNLIEGLGGTVDGNSFSSLYTVINNFKTSLENRTSSLEVSRYYRIGEIVTTLSATPPNDCLPCNGAVYSKSDYQDLIDYALSNGLFPSSQSESISIYNQGYWGKLLNLGHLETDVNFRTPNLQGMFLRMTGGNAGTVGYYQRDELKSHTHTEYYPQHNIGSGAYGNYGGGEITRPIFQRNTGATGGVETRPQNITVNFWIRYQ